MHVCEGGECMCVWVDVRVDGCACMDVRAGVVGGCVSGWMGSYAWMCEWVLGE